MEKHLLDQIKTLKILLVDDDSFSLRILRHILYGLGAEKISDAFNGESALEQLNKQHFDFLITDVEMPKLNGLGLLKAIRCGATQIPRDLPTIIITGLNNSEVLVTSISLDVNGFLAKPMKPADVGMTISNALNESVAIKPISHYEAVNTNLKSLGQKAKPAKESVNASILNDQTEAEKTKTHQAHASQNGGEQVFVRELKPGMRIAQDIYLKDNSLLLKAGYALSESTINRLGDLRDVLADEVILVLPAEADEDI